jgi:hypothetical protein
MGKRRHSRQVYDNQAFIASYHHATLSRANAGDGETDRYDGLEFAFAGFPDPQFTVPTAAGDKDPTILVALE